MILRAFGLTGLPPPRLKPAQDHLWATYDSKQRLRVAALPSVIARHCPPVTRA
jgi:hypothetical protein